MKNSKSPHRPPEISPESFSFPQKNPQGNIISRQICRKFRVSEPTVTMHRNAITAHTLRKQYNPTGQVTFFRTIYPREKIPTISPQHIFRTQKNTPRPIRHKQYAPDNKTTRNTQEAPAPHGPGASPCFYVSEYCFMPAKSNPGNPSTTNLPPHPAEAAHAQDPAPPLHPHHEKPSQWRPGTPSTRLESPHVRRGPGC